jgi:hypothetical protein
VSGATSSSYSFTASASQTGYRYRCALTAGLSAVTSSSATLTVVSAFSATAVMLTSGTSYTVPSGATTMKAWAVGAGSTCKAKNGGAGGCAYKTWSVTGGQSVSYSAAGVTNIPSDYSGAAGGDSTVTYSGTTITGNGAPAPNPYTDYSNGGPGGGYSGGDGGANGGAGNAGYGEFGIGGAVANTASNTNQNPGYGGACGRRVMVDVSGLKAALALAGVSTTETCSRSAPAFGSGAYVSKYVTNSDVAWEPGIGGGGAENSWPTYSNGGRGAVVLYFT